MDIARQFRAAGVQVCIGGFHVSGCIAMLPEMPSEMREAQAMGDLAVRRRGGGASARRGASRRVARRAEAALQLHGSAPLARGRARADPAAQTSRAHDGPLFLDRPRPRLSLSVLVLHHHQRAGPQEPLPYARRPGTDHSREQGAGHRSVLHHRRQFRPQQRLGDPARPGDQAPGRGHPLRLHHPGRHALPQDPELHREGDQGRSAAHLHRAREHQSRTI